ncbi:MAG: hypothetical protein VX420_02300 [SAR324 cluster bacterium]|nr:hypothetical protein [SAR324 cluster bacterium]
MLTRSLTHHELQQHPELVVELLGHETDITVVVRRKGDQVTLLQQKHFPEVDEIMSANLSKKNRRDIRLKPPFRI